MAGLGGHLSQQDKELMEAGVHPLTEGKTSGAMCPKTVKDKRRPIGPPPCPKPKRIRQSVHSVHFEVHDLSAINSAYIITKIGNETITTHLPPGLSQKRKTALINEIKETIKKVAIASL